MSRWRIKLGGSVPCCILLALLLTGPLRAEEMDTGNYLLRQCRSAIGTPDDKTDFVDGAYCLGFIRSAYQSLQFLQGYDENMNYCLPEDGMTGEQAVRIVVKYLNANPEKLHENAYGLSVIAIGGAYPCPVKGAGR